MRAIFFAFFLLFVLNVDAQNPDNNPIDLGLGWNLGNQFDAYRDGVADERAWYNGEVTPELFQAVRRAGFDSVRIPITWLGRVGSAPDYIIDSTWLDRVDEVVDWALECGLKVIINIHHDGASSKHWLNVKRAAQSEEYSLAVERQLSAMWRQIALRFRDKSENLVFESLNEIHDGKWGHGSNLKDGGRQYETLNRWNQIFVDTVRSTGGGNATRWLGVPGYCTNPELTIAHFRLPKDSVKDRILVSIHYYDPYLFTLENRVDKWGNESKRDSSDFSDEQAVSDIFERINQHFVKQGVGVYIGEAGCSRRKNSKDERYRINYLEWVSRCAARNGLSLFVWDNGSRHSGRECHGYFDHSTGELLSGAKECIEAMVRGYYGE